MCALQIPFSMQKSGSQLEREETGHELGGTVQLKIDGAIMNTKWQEVRRVEIPVSCNSNGNLETSCRK